MSLPDREVTDDREYQFFCQKIHALTELDLGSYKRNQMDRRLRSLMERLGVSGYVEYAQLLERDAHRLQEFRQYITINVSEFFRNPEKFIELQTKILPDLLQPGQPLKVWSAGCSNGAEPYTMAMILDEVAPLRQHTIQATDIDLAVLAMARAGVYGENDIRNVSPARLQKYFTVSDGKYRVSDAIRSRVRFAQGDLLGDKFSSGWDLIICRNVTIYFTDAAKDGLYRKFHAALRPGGVLFVGGTESILNAREMGLTTIAPFFYRRQG